MTNIEGGTHANLERKGIYIRQVQETGKVQIPKDIRKAFDLKKGDSVVWFFGKDSVKIRFMSTSLDPKTRKD